MCGGMDHIVHEQNLEMKRLNALLNSIPPVDCGSKAEVKKRVSLTHEISKYEDSIEELKVSIAKAQRLMLSNLSDEERNVIRLRCFKQYRWNMVAKRAAMSRSSCFRVYMGALDHLCLAWDK